MNQYGRRKENSDSEVTRRVQGINGFILEGLGGLPEISISISIWHMAAYASPLMYILKHPLILQVISIPHAYFFC